jgi:hypothetical protein
MHDIYLTTKSTGRTIWLGKKNYPRITDGYPKLLQVICENEKTLLNSIFNTEDDTILQLLINSFNNKYNEYNMYYVKFIDFPSSSTSYEMIVMDLGYIEYKINKI